MKKAIVIGAGFGGMAAAIRLTKKGYKVEIVDRCNSLGGRAQVFNVNGFRHDAGPTLITAPFLFDELFSLFGKERKKFLNFIPLDPWYRFYFYDNTTFDYCRQVSDTKKEIAKFSKKDSESYEKLLKVSKEIFDVGFTLLSD